MGASRTAAVTIRQGFMQFSFGSDQHRIDDDRVNRAIGVTDDPSQLTVGQIIHRIGHANHVAHIQRLITPWYPAGIEAPPYARELSVVLRAGLSLSLR